jgi:hypothetical protein
MSKGLNIVGSKRFDGTSREIHDYYATDPKVIQDLYRFENIKGFVWENAVGEGNLYNEIIKLPSVDKVIGTDLIDRCKGKFKINDFLKDNNPFKIKPDWIITNPPYKYGKEWVLRSLEAVNDEGKVALLMKLAFLESVSRYEMFKSTPLRNVYVYSKRVGVYKNNIKTKNSGLTAYAWYVWDKSFTNNVKPQVDWIIS